MRSHQMAHDAAKQGFLSDIIPFHGKIVATHLTTSKFYYIISITFVYLPSV